MPESKNRLIPYQEMLSMLRRNNNPKAARLDSLMNALHQSTGDDEHQVMETILKEFPEIVPPETKRMVKSQNRDDKFAQSYSTESPATQKVAAILKTITSNIGKHRGDEADMLRNMIGHYSRELAEGTEVVDVVSGVQRALPQILQANYSAEEIATYAGPADFTDIFNTKEPDDVPKDTAKLMAAYNAAINRGDWEPRGATARLIKKLDPLFHVLTVPVQDRTPEMIAQFAADDWLDDVPPSPDLMAIGIGDTLEFSADELGTRHTVDEGRAIQNLHGTELQNRLGMNVREMKVVQDVLEALDAATS